MLFDRPLVPAVLVQRYKRFLFDAVLEDGRAITGSCPNTGSMRGLTTPGSRIWLSEHDSPTRKYQHMFEMVEVAAPSSASIPACQTGWRKKPSRPDRSAICISIRRSSVSRNMAAIRA